MNDARSNARQFVGEDEDESQKINNTNNNNNNNNNNIKRNSRSRSRSRQRSRSTSRGNHWCTIEINSIIFFKYNYSRSSSTRNKTSSFTNGFSSTPITP
jgi:hypothetical protein